jgi:acyl-CoA thioesterase-1
MIFSLLFICLGLAATAAHGETVLVFGDSLSSAYGMQAPRGWVALLEQRLKRERPDYSVANASISGETSAGGLARIGKALERSKPSVVILELGANDGLRGLPVAEMSRNLSSIIEQSQKAGARVLLVGMRLPPNYGDAYTGAFAQAYVELAKRHRIELLPFLLDGVAERPELFQGDRIHPTDAAQPAVLANVWKKLDPLLRKRKVAAAPPRAAR